MINIIIDKYRVSCQLDYRYLQEQSWQSFKKLYLIMDEAQLIFSVNPLKVRKIQKGWGNFLTFFGHFVLRSRSRYPT